MKKAIFKKQFLVYLSPIIAVPALSVVSCSNSKGFTITEDEQNIITALSQQGVIKTSINSPNANLKISDLKNINYSFEAIKPSDNSLGAQDAYDKIKNSLSKVSIKLESYLLPKFGEDINSYLVFRVNEVDKLIYVPITSLYIDQRKISNQDLTNLTEAEISKLTEKTLLNEKFFVNNLQLKVSNYLNNLYQEGTDINQWWNSIKENLKTELKQWFSDTFLFFNDRLYKNIFVDVINFSFAGNKLDFAVSISTTDFTVNSNCTYNQSVTVYLPKSNNSPR